MGAKLEKYLGTHPFKLNFSGCSWYRLLLVCGSLVKVLARAYYVLSTLYSNRGSGSYSLSDQAMRSPENPAKGLLGYTHGFSCLFLR